MPVINPIYLNEEDSKKFLWFMEHYEVINKIIKSGTFDVKLGSSIINFDSNGNISSIEVRQIYR